MTPEATIQNYLTFRRAVTNSDAALLASRIVATGEDVAVVACVSRSPDGFEIAPIGYLKVPEAIEAGRLSATAKQAFNDLQFKLRNSDYQAWFQEDEQHRVHVAVSDKRPIDEDFTLVLAWDDPYTLFAPPIEN